MTKQTASTGAKPTYRIYRVSGDGEKSTWTPIGAAWANKDGTASRSAATPCRFRAGS